MTEALIHHLWQSTLCVGAAALLALAFRKNSAKVRFYIWLAASLKFLIPFSLFVWAGSHLRWATAPALPASSTASTLMDQLSQPAAYLASQIAPAPDVIANPTFAWNGWMIVLGIWLLGFIVLLCRRLFQWLYLLAIVKAAAPVDVDVPIPVYETQSTLEPGLFGILSPTLLLPAGIAAHLTPAQLDAIVAHELCHWHRRDNLSAAIHMLVEALFWFHPLVWWLGARMVVERERACDEAVIGSGNDRQTYAEGILRVCQHYVEPPLCSAGVSGGSLRKRIEEIMTTPVLGRLPVTKKLLLSLSACAAVAVPVAVGMLAGVGSSAGIARAGDTGQWPMKHYRNDQFKFELDVPKAWVMMPPVPSNSQAEIIRFASQDQGSHGLIVFRNPRNPQMTPDQILARTQEVLAKGGFSNFVPGETTVGSRRVFTLDFEKPTADNQAMLYCRHYFIMEGALMYVLGFGSSNRDAMFGLYDRMAKTFAFEET